MDEKLKSENEHFSMFILYFESNQGGRCRERHYADHIFIQIYFRMHQFVVKFCKFYSPQAARGHWPPNQNPADVTELVNWYFDAAFAFRLLRILHVHCITYFTLVPSFLAYGDFFARNVCRKHFVLHRVPKMEDSVIMAASLLILDGFLKFFRCQILQ